VTDPFTEGGRIFRTGDFGRYLPNGEIEFLGRTDQQVKVRGFRVELTEIEAMLRRSVYVHESVVITDGNDDRTRIVAYVVKQDGVAVDSGNLRSYLAKHLPEYMVPVGFVFLDKLPLTPAGKLDRSALPPPIATRGDIAAPYEAGRNPTETKLATLWSDLLRIDEVGVHDDFFELGGDSLAAVTMLFRVADILEVEVPVEHFRGAPTIDGLWCLIEEARGQDSRVGVDSISTIQRESQLPVSINQEFRLANQLRRELEGRDGKPAHTGFAFRFEGKLDIGALEHVINIIIDRHEAFRTGFVPIASVGTYTLEGWDSIKRLFGRGPIRPAIRFQSKLYSSPSFAIGSPSYPKKKNSENRKPCSNRKLWWPTPTWPNVWLSPMRMLTLTKERRKQTPKLPKPRRPCR
jgi:acyl carrier protein